MEQLQVTSEEEKRPIDCFYDAYERVRGSGRYQWCVLGFCFFSSFSYIALPALLEIDASNQPNLGGRETSITAAIESDGSLGSNATNVSAGMQSSTMLALGGGIGILPLSMLSDWFGRLVVLGVGNVANFVLLVCWAFKLADLTLFAFGIGLTTVFNYLGTFIFLYDSDCVAAQVPNGVLVAMSWGVAEILIATGILYFRALVILILALCSLFSLVFLCWIKESPRFYYNKRQYPQALRQLRHIASINGKHLPSPILWNVEVNSDPPTSYWSRRCPELSARNAKRGNFILFILCFTVTYLIKSLLGSIMAPTEDKWVHVAHGIGVIISCLICWYIARKRNIQRALFFLLIALGGFWLLIYL